MPTAATDGLAGSEFRALACPLTLSEAALARDGVCDDAWTVVQQYGTSRSIERISSAVLLEFPIPIVEWTNLASLKPA